MGVSVKRNTGMMGGLAKIAVVVDNEHVVKLGNSEETTVGSGDAPVKLQARQWFFGSKKLEAAPGSRVEVRINSTAMILFLAAFICLIFSVVISPLISAAALVLFILVIVYGMNNWFQLDELDEK
ncbi:hypothetical protein SAMN05421503_0309 [Terribacillus aidingensis]|uniref:Uncharacterized protein n=1 Tax=Terribacillus aidingensis TaxID=586416 RepID=A0A285N193_9BACI|nr:hypothetical protein [Terribacillus aidingensis]SNZ03222.1 hypothetical protein SAMN05421503_0309 [Terribacillus aidingensis]